MLSKGHLLRGSRLHAAIPGSVQARLYSSLNTEKKPDEAEHGSEYSSDKAKQSADFFTAGVRSTIGTVVQNVKVAVGLEKPLGKEGAGSMEPAGIMENKSGEGSRAEQYADLIASKKQKSDELTKGARVEELYSEAPVRAQAQNKPEDRKPFRHEEP